MKYWPLNQLYFLIFLAIGFVFTVPFVLGSVGDFWWIALPAIVAWSAVIWIWGLPWIAPEETKNSSLFEKAVATMIMLGQSFVGVVLAVFLIGVLIHEWVALILGIALTAALMFWASRPSPKPDPKRPPETLPGWVGHHVSLILFLVFGWFTFSDDLDRQSYVPGWPSIGMVLAYVAFVWTHVASPQPGEPQTSIPHRLLITVVTFVATAVVLTGLTLIVMAFHELAIVIVPPIGIGAMLLVLNWRNLPPWRKAPPPSAPARPRRKARGPVVS